MLKNTAHPLEKWRQSAGIKTRAAAARLLGISPQLWNEVVHGRCGLSSKRMREIDRITAGAIDVRDLVFWTPA
jgi:DNA-binding transcriptional regulator YdaS (Cro superfamily)